MTNWKSTYKSHLDDLVDNMGQNSTGFIGKKKTIRYDKARVVISVPSNNLTTVEKWLDTLKKDWPNLEFNVVTVESLL